jgi:hypothetical protein
MVVNVISLPDRQRQQRGETLREFDVRAGQVRLVTTTPDGARITEILTPDEAREWAEDLIEAAADAEEAIRG